MKINLSVNDVAVKQLESAIWMYAYDYDEVAVHTIAGAAFELYNERLDIIKFKKIIGKSIIPERINEFISLWNMPYNFFKHGQHKRKPIETITYETELVEDLIFWASEANLRGPEEYRLNAALIFKTYYIINHPDIIDKKVYDETYGEARKKVNMSDEELKSRETLRTLLDMIKRTKPTFLNGKNSPYDDKAEDLLY